MVVNFWILFILYLLMVTQEWAKLQNYGQEQQKLGETTFLVSELEKWTPVSYKA